MEKDNFVATLPVDHPLTDTRRLIPADLADEPFVLYAANDIPGLYALMVGIGLTVACASSQETSAARRFFVVVKALADGVAA